MPALSETIEPEPLTRPSRPAPHPSRDCLDELVPSDAIQSDGRVYISNAVLGGRFVLRACVVNFRTEAADMDAVLEVAEEIGSRLDKELRPAALAAG